LVASVRARQKLMLVDTLGVASFKPGKTVRGGRRGPSNAAVGRGGKVLG